MAKATSGRNLTFYPQVIFNYMIVLNE